MGCDVIFQFFGSVGFPRSFLQIWREINLRPTRATHLRCCHLRTFRPVTSHSFHPTTLYSHLPPNHTIQPHTQTLPPVTQDLTPDLTPTHHVDITRPRPVTELQAQERWRWLSRHTHGPQTHERRASTRSGDTEGSDITCPCMRGGEETSASTLF